MPRRAGICFSLMPMLAGKPSNGVVDAGRRKRGVYHAVCSRAPQESSDRAFTPTCAHPMRPAKMRCRNETAR